MGLDMYMEKVKRIGNATKKDIYTIDKYLDWSCRPTKYKDCAMGDWNGTDEKHLDSIDRNLIYAYMSEMKKRFYYWDKEKEYGTYTIFESVGYWRKANQIHNWFVGNVQNGEDDCGSYEVSKEQLEELLDICENVRDCFDNKGKIKDIKTVTELLPTENGFFFGSTDYDEWYYEDIKKTIKILKNVLKHTDFDKEMVIYSSSW